MKEKDLTLSSDYEGTFPWTNTVDVALTNINNACGTPSYRILNAVDNDPEGSDHD